ncbi:hypothetical protein [Halostreptopolyspora alba]|uniref:Uncharacterized protein n=1 Tax=Halostreptopolyspora alba TaxID=2487137 RepID=A0A3N0E966_9ACTN|nr:hypothetical protein EFW17_12420 [Nocardiopsaceae bacterium YIM 96095]
MSQSHHPSDDFEERLLGDLLREVRQRSEAAPEAAPARPTSRSLRPRTVGVAVAAAGAGAAMVVTPALLPGDGGPQPAFAVEEGGDGTVRVELDRVELDMRDPAADELERTLEEHGIPAVVESIPAGHICEQPRYERAQRLTSHIEMDTRVAESGIRHQLVIDPSEWSEEHTLVLGLWETEGDVEPTASQLARNDGVMYDVAKGEVDDCELREAPGMEREEPVGDTTRGNGG